MKENIHSKSTTVLDGLKISKVMYDYSMVMEFNWADLIFSISFTSVAQSDVISKSLKTEQLLKNVKCFTSQRKIKNIQATWIHLLFWQLSFIADNLDAEKARLLYILAMYLTKNEKRVAREVN